MARQTDREPSRLEVWRGRLLNIAVLVIALGIAFCTARDAYAGLATGCIKAKYGYLCRDVAPIRFWASSVAAILVSLVSLGVSTVAALLLRHRLRARY